LLSDYRWAAVQNDGQVTLTVAGEVDLPVRDDFIAMGAGALEVGPRVLVIDLSDVTFIDSAGLSGLVQLRSGQAKPG
jgi:anti-anti-sigma factor